MEKIYFIVALLVLPFIFQGQQRLIKFKYVADKIVKKHFDFPLTRTKCSVDSKIDFDGRESIFTSEYIPSDTDQEKFLSVTLKYSVFSDQINDWYPIYITIDSNKIIQRKIQPFASIPSCILKNSGCNFIKRDSAINIAKRDSIWYPNNIQTEFYYNEKVGRFFWSITGYSGKKGQITASSKQYKRIDAMTGEIIR